MTTAEIQAVEKPRGESQTRQQPDKPVTSARPSAAERYDRIAKAAYLRAERRGFLPGTDLSDWLAAEAEVDKVRAQIA